MQKGNSFIDGIRVIFRLPLLESILQKLTNDKYYGAAITKFPPNHYSYKIGTHRHVQREGLRLNLDLSELVDWFEFWGFKELSRESLLNQIKKGDTVFDIGGNNGILALKMASTTGVNGGVYSFEPDPDNFNRLMGNVNLNNLKIEAHNIGFSDKPEKSFITVVDKRNLGKNRILKDSAGKPIVLEDLDSFVNKSDLANIDLIKIDVEGFEMKVLTGGIETIKKYQPKLFIEVDDSNLREQGSSASEVMAFLKFNSYTSVHAESQELIDADFDFTNCHFDILAIPK
jgi:FkbM family methyltransferase